MHHSSCENKKARLVAFYLPQYHPIPENDNWWGKGFTEWTNVSSAKKLFWGHYQPHIPADLGFYDLRVPEIREDQAEMASHFGIEAFCYWHYWFGNGKRLLHLPLEEVAKSKVPNFPLCLAWANENWTGAWKGKPDRILVKQQYPGKKDYIQHFRSLIHIFKDKRYLKINGRNIFIIYRPDELPDALEFTSLWHKLALEEVGDDFYFIGFGGPDWCPQKYGFDAKIVRPDCAFRKWYNNMFLNAISTTLLNRSFSDLISDIFRLPHMFDYSCVVERLEKCQSGSERDCHPVVLSNWDNTPRFGRRGSVVIRSSPGNFKDHLNRTINNELSKPFEERLIFIKSWNEWAEGNYVEPDQKFGKGYLEVIKQEVMGHDCPDRHSCVDRL